MSTVVPGTLGLTAAEIKRQSDQAQARMSDLMKRAGCTEQAKDLVKATSEMLKAGLPNLSPILPLLLSLKGRPYSLDNHFPFEPFFNTLMPRKIVLKAGRQVAKSTSLASQGVITSGCIPFFNTLYVMPLFEMARRFSNNYVAGFIEQSPIGTLWTSTKTSSNVLQRSFTNHSNMFFSFAFLNADRTRGINADKMAIDEVQDMEAGFIPIIRETMSGSPYGGLEQYAGTPKTLDNTIEKLWQNSSMAEWAVPCTHCNYENIPSLDYDLDDMIGPWHDDISEDHPATICAKCQRPVFPRQGYWLHRRPQLIPDFAGYHTPQLIMPMHHADPDKWRILLGKREGWFGTPQNVFYNEVCGESFDTGSRLVTESELKAASVLHKNDKEEAKRHIGKYLRRILSVDWGGGGIDEVSFTTYAVLGMLPDGTIEVIYGYRSLTPHDSNREARIALQLVAEFQCSHIAHDYCGAGAQREQFIVNAGYPLERIAPIAYVRAATQSIFKLKPATEQHPREHYSCDKARSLALTCGQIKNGQLRFFQYDYINDDQTGLISDFLALAEEKSSSRLGRDVYTIIRVANKTDDFAQAVNMGCCCLWYMADAWPDVAAAEKYRIGFDVLEALKTPNTEWEDI